MLYDHLEPILALGLPFSRMTVSSDWSAWPSLTDLFPTTFSGVTTSRDTFLVDADLDLLKKRVADYF